MQKKGDKYKGSIFYKSTKTLDLPLKAIKRRVPPVFAKKLIHKSKNVWKRKVKFVAENKLTFYTLKHKIMAIKAYKNYKRKTKLWKTQSGLFFQLPKKFFFKEVFKTFFKTFFATF